MKIILASASPRRQKLLSEAGFDFVTDPSTEEEKKEDNILPEELARKLAVQKADSVAKRYFKDGAITEPTAVIGADTIVVFENEVLGKPKDKADAVRTLTRLSGNEHEVITGYCVIYGISNIQSIVGHVKSRVRFNKLSSQLISEYVESGSPLDKAGSYGVQDGYDIVKEIRGSFTNVVGLPMEEITRTLNAVETTIANSGETKKEF